jgi:sulfhydrogenase subunit beta (sulfur reductase)
MGTAVVHEGFDVLLTKVGNHYVVDAPTEKGEALLAGMADAPNATGADLAARAEIWRANGRLLRKHELRMFPSDLPHLLKDCAEHPVWAEMAEKCFSCGSCTNSCPTCYCFDVQDKMNWDMKSGTRERTWDSCQLAAFARVAGGHNFRKDRVDRYRHRYMRKGKYVPEIIGQCACVGCGRCISACVAKIAQPVTVWNRLLEEK